MATHPNLYPLAHTRLSARSGNCYGAGLNAFGPHCRYYI
jgi:hypothetical protein